MRTSDENIQEVSADIKERKMIVVDLYENCKAQLKTLWFTLQGRHTGGFDGRYKGKHILRVGGKEHKGLSIDVDVKKAYDQWRGWEPANDKQTLDKIFNDYTKPMVAKINVSEIATIARDMGAILKIGYPPETYKKDINVRLKQLEDELQTLKAIINALK